MPRTCLDTADAIELAETLQLIAGWLTTDPATLAPSFLAYIGHPAYGTWRCSVALGASAVCLEWSAGRALAAGASEDEIAGVLLAIASVAGLGRIVCAAPEVATALEYDITTALEEPGDR